MAFFLAPSSLFLIVVVGFPLLTTTAARIGMGNVDDVDEPLMESVSFQGQREGEHFTIKVEEGHRFRCFETKEELVDAVDKYNGYNHVDVELAEKYGWPIGMYLIGLYCIRFGSLDSAFGLYYKLPLVSSTVTSLSCKGNWCTRDITDMSDLFYDHTYFNEDIGKWSVKKVTDMTAM